MGIDHLLPHKTGEDSVSVAIQWLSQTLDWVQLWADTEQEHDHGFGVFESPLQSSLVYASLQDGQLGISRIREYLMKSLSRLIASIIISMVIVPTTVKANYGDFDGGVAIGSSYAGVDTAPTNGLIVQGNVGVGTASPQAPLHSTVGSAAFYTGGYTWGGIVANMDNLSGQSGLLVENAWSTSTSNAFEVASNWNGSSNAFTPYFLVAGGGNVGIGTTSPAQKLEVNGEVKVDTFASASATTVCQNGNVLSTCSSSIRYKEKVKPASFGLPEVMEMRPITFKWKDRDEEDFGLLAEDIEKINPLFVTYARGRVSPAL